MNDKNTCNKCIYDLSVESISFDEEGVCNYCNQISELSELYGTGNKKGEESFNNILNKIRISGEGKDYDCVIGVSGGKDSLRQATWVRDKLNLRPLLVCGAFPPEQLTNVGAQNLSNLIDLGFDLVVSTPSPQFWKKAMKRGFFQGNY